MWKRSLTLRLNVNSRKGTQSRTFKRGTSFDLVRLTCGKTEDKESLMTTSSGLLTTKFLVIKYIK